MARNKINEQLPIPVRGVIKELGQMIAAARKERQMTQDNLAQRVGVRRATIGRMEHGAPEIAMGYYLTAAWIFGLPLFTWTDFAVRRSGSAMSAYLKNIKQQLPRRVKYSKDNIKNDF